MNTSHFVPVVHIPEPITGTATGRLTFDGEVLAGKGTPCAVQALIWAAASEELRWVVGGVSFPLGALRFDHMTGPDFAAFMLRAEAQLRGFVA